MQPRIPTAFIYLLAAVADAWLLLWHQPLNQPSLFSAVLGFLAAVLFILAAGFWSRRQHFANICAVAGVVALPWIYTTTLRGNIYVNQWIIFNVPDKELRFYNGLARAELTILAVLLIFLGIGIAILRLLPSRCLFRSIPFRDRTWPAVGASFCLIAIWYSQSVMPYRIPGALDYSDWPILQILHIQKHGLQFHETCVKVWGYRGAPNSVSLSWNDRRQLKYRFQQRSAPIEVSGTLGQRLTALIHSLKTVKSNREAITPLRRWEDEAWYIAGEGEWRVYARENHSTPPQEVVDLFHELEKLPRTQETSQDRKDVCLGFCYDPLAALGALYANHRCRWDETRIVCR